MRRKRWPASPAPGLLALGLGFGLQVTFKRTKLLPTILLCKLCASCPGNKILSVIHGTEPIDWFAIFTFRFLNFTPKFVPDNCLQTATTITNEL